MVFGHTTVWLTIMNLKIQIKNFKQGKQMTDMTFWYIAHAIFNGPYFVDDTELPILGYFDIVNLIREIYFCVTCMA